MEIEDLRAALEELSTRLQVSENKLDVIARMQGEGEDAARTLSGRNDHYEDIATTITNPDQIQLETYKSIPTFDGDKRVYQSWRNQVIRQMKMIENFKGHPKYGAALAIIRAKISGAASDALTNNKTAHNIDAIIEQLDASYSDQRPLYITEAEMTSIRQNGKTLQEYYDAINQALNLVISRILLTYKIPEEQKVLISQAQIKAIRTFIIGLKSYAMRNLLYGGRYHVLSDVYKSAQTIYYDNQYLELDAEARRMSQNNPSKSRPHMQFKRPAPKFDVNVNCNQPLKNVVQNVNRPEPMEVDNSKQYKQTTNWKPNPNWRQKNNDPQKRGYDSSRQQSQQQYKMQRINNFQDENPNDDYEGDLCDTIPEDLLSVTSEATAGTSVSSAFLDE